MLILGPAAAQGEQVLADALAHAFGDGGGQALGLLVALTALVTDLHLAGPTRLVAPFDAEVGGSGPGGVTLLGDAVRLRLDGVEEPPAPGTRLAAGDPLGTARGLPQKILAEQESITQSAVSQALKRAGAGALLTGARLLADAGIVRNRLKVAAAITNARAAEALLEAEGDGALDRLVWSFAPDPATRPMEPDASGRPRPRVLAEVPAITDDSKALAKGLKARGFVFVGPTTAYALMQACGLVDDHVVGCHRAT